MTATASAPHVISVADCAPGSMLYGEIVEFSIGKPSFWTTTVSANG